MSNQRTLRTRKVVVGTWLSVAGAVTLTLVSLIQSVPEPLWLWAFFALSVTVLEWRAVEVNDRLLMTPSIMVIITTGAIFGAESGVLAVAGLAAVGFLTPADVRGRRIFQPVANFGQLIISGCSATAVLGLLRPTVIDGSNVGQLAAAAALAAIIYGAVNYLLVTTAVRYVYGRQIRPWSHLSAALVPYVGMGFLGGMLGATYLLVGPVSLPLIAAVFFVGYMTFASYGDLREAQDATLRGFVKALEAKDLYTRGHTERVAHFSEMIGAELGYDANGLERLRWAALIHDVGKLAVPRELITKKIRLTTAERELMERHVHSVEDLLSEVDFLQPMVDIAAKHHSNFDGSGYGGSAHTHGESPGPDACILAVADAFDAMTSTRSYRVALTQQYAFGELRANAGTQFDPEAVEALITALEKTGEIYGSLDIADEEQARLLAGEDQNPYRVHG